MLSLSFLPSVFVMLKILVFVTLKEPNYLIIYEGEIKADRSGQDRELVELCSHNAGIFYIITRGKE